MNNKTLSFLLFGGAIAYFLSTQNNVSSIPPASYTPPPTQQINTPAWTIWARTIIQIYGFSADLFKQGGPLNGFFKSETEFTDWINTTGQNFEDYA